MTTNDDRRNRTLATNRKAYHDYSIEETYEVGLALSGTEIKSLRAGQCNLKDGYAVIREGEIWMLNVHISPWAGGNRENHDPLRERKLLLHRVEINKLASRVAERGWTLVPLRIYLKDNRAKVELGLVRGKKQYDKRDAIARRDADRDLQRAVKDYQQD